MKVLVTLTDREHMHGHEWASRHPLRALIDYADGTFRDRRHAIRRASDYFLGDQRATYLRVHYRHSTSPIRLQRTHGEDGTEVGTVLNIHWFGGRTVIQDSEFDNQPVLCWIMNVAKERNQANPGSVTTVLLPKRKVYEYYGTVEIPDGITLAGGGAVELAEVTDDLGHVYRPVRMLREHTRLRLNASEIERYFRMMDDPDSTGYIEPDIKFFLGMRGVAIGPETNLRWLGLRDLVLDGNIHNVDQGVMHRRRLQTYMLSHPGIIGIIGINASDHGGKKIPEGQKIEITNVKLTSYGLSGLLGNTNNRWTVQNMILSDTGWGHLGAEADYENLTLSGFVGPPTSWSGTWSAGRIRNLVAEGLRGAPDGVLSIRGGDLHDREEAVPPWFEVPSDQVGPRVGTEVDGFYIDMRGARRDYPFSGIGPHIHIRNGVVIGGRGLFDEPYGWQQNLYKDNIFENIVIYNTGDRGSIMQGWNVTESYLRNVQTRQDLMEQEAQIAHVLGISANHRHYPAWDNPQTVVYDQLIETAASDSVAQTTTHPKAAGRDTFIVNSSFNNRTNFVFVAADDQGRLESLERPQTLRVFMANTRFRLWNCHFAQLEILFAIARFQDCTDLNSGRMSEDCGTFTGDGRQTELLVATNLFWQPLEDHFTTFAGPAAEKMESFAYTDADGNALGDDKRQPYLKVLFREAPAAGETLDWRSAVRPWEEGVEVPKKITKKIRE